MTKTPPLAPAEILGIMNEADKQEQIRNFDTHAPLKAPSPLAARIQHLLHMALELDERGVEAVINCAAFHRRYPKE